MNISLPSARKYDHSNPSAGYIYVLHPIGVETYKIGYSVNLPQRIAKLQFGKDYQLEFVAYMWDEDATGREVALHHRFGRKHLSGEWFALTPEDIEYIKDCLNER